MDPDRALLDEQIAYYRLRAPEYDATTTPDGDPYAAHSTEIESSLETFGPRGHILEIACGTGNWTGRLARSAARVTALDASHEMLDLAAEKAGEGRVEFVRADIFSWRPPRRYDDVFFANWLSHVPLGRFEDFWALVARCLGSAGRVFFVDEAADAWRKESWEGAEDGRRTQVARRTLNDGTTHRIVKIFWDPEELEERLRGLGWDASVVAAGPFFWGTAARSDLSV